ncbi:unnamed protein product [Brachionus calyciflorus]|uniref:Uncharacterized protein n=1 Tax=Brachionus calyciflorus TaxID=104777 RepID=A0A813T867_9BILA|nr:unnamed protein product [Brachionus calyciflorus]
MAKMNKGMDKQINHLGLRNQRKEFKIKLKKLMTLNRTIYEELNSDNLIIPNELVNKIFNLKLNSHKFNQNFK